MREDVPSMGQTCRWKCLHVTQKDDEAMAKTTNDGERQRDT